MESVAMLLHSPRRLAVGAATAMAVFALTGGVSGFVQAAIDDIPAAFSVPGRSLGDVAEYEIAVGDDGANGGAWSIRAERLVAMLDASGRPVWAEVDQGGPPLTDRISGTFYAVATGQMIGFGTRTATEFEEVRDVEGPVPLTEVVTGYDVVVDQMYMDAPAPCLRWNGFMGQTVRLDRPAYLFGPCWIGVYGAKGLVIDEIYVKPVSHEDGTLHLRGRVDAIHVDAWLTETAPFASRLLVRAPTVTYDARLADVTVGDAPFPTTAPDVAGAPPLAFTSPRPWGADEAAFVHEFSPQQAYQAAYDHPVSSLLRDWASLHPGHSPVHLDYTVAAAWPDGIERRWDFQLSDSKSILDISVTWRQATAVAALGVSGVAEIEVAGSSRTLQDGKADEHPVQGWPTAASMQARMDAFMPALGGAAITEWKPLSRPAMTGPGDWDWEVRARSGQLDAGAPSLGQGRDTIDARLFIDRDGQVRSMHGEAHASTIEARHVASPKLPPAVDPIDDAPAAAGRVEAWQPPAAEAMVGLGTLAVAAGAARFAWPAIRVAFIMGFTRIRHPKLMLHPVRARIVRAIEADPGVHFSELRRRLELASGKATHHLQLLTKAGVVKMRQEGGYTSYFPARSRRDQMAAAPALRARSARKMLEAIVHNPGRSAGDLAREVGVSNGTTTHHLKRLEKAGLVEVTRHGRRISLVPTESGRRLAP